MFAEKIQGEEKRIKVVYCINIKREGKKVAEDLRENNDWVLRLPIGDLHWSTCCFALR